jgi:hypothetical protein
MIKLTHYFRMILSTARVATSMEAVFQAAHLRCYSALVKVRTPEQVRLYGELRVPSKVTPEPCVKTYFGPRIHGISAQVHRLYPTVYFVGFSLRYSRLIEFDLLLRQAADIPTSRQDTRAEDMVFGSTAMGVPFILNSNKNGEAWRGLVP